MLKFLALLLLAATPFLLAACETGGSALDRPSTASQRDEKVEVDNPPSQPRLNPGGTFR